MEAHQLLALYKDPKLALVVFSILLNMKLKNEILEFERAILCRITDSILIY